MKILIIAITVLCGLALQAQSPEAINYQAVARDGSGQVMANENITVRFTLKQGGATGTIVYQETHTLSTNSFGLFTAAIGLGTPATGTFGNINWGNASHFIQVEVNAGAGYLDMGTTQLLSVPYALYAKEAGNTGGTTYQAGSGIDITGNTISNTAPNQPVTLTGSGATQVSGTYPAFTISSTDSDNQTLSLSGSNLSISGGNVVTLPTSGGTITGVTAGTGLTGGGSSGTVTLNAQTTSPLWNAGQIQGRNVAASAPNTGQVLKWNGSAWAPDVDNSGSTYNAGTGITLSGTTFNAQNNTGIWNANKLQGNDISSAAPSADNILKWTGTQWIPTVNADTSHWHKTGNYIYTRQDSVGIGLYSSLVNIYPKARLHVQNGNVIFGTGDFKIEYQGTYVDANLGNQFKWDESKGSVRLGTVYNPIIIGTGWLPEGSNSFSAGDRSQASGTGATAFGRLSIAQGPNSFAAGDSAVASDSASVAIGYRTKATGAFSSAFGRRSSASAYASFAAGDTAVASSTGAFALGTYARASGPNAFAIGLFSKSSGNTSIAIGGYSEATGTNATAIGYGSKATGYASMAILGGKANGSGSFALLEGNANSASTIASGYLSEANNTGAVAIGENVQAHATYAFALGTQSRAHGGSSFVLGNNLIARSVNETVIGRFNSDYVSAGGGYTWNTNDRLFVIGNGSSNVSRSSALVMLKNGRTAIGNTTPVTTLHVYHGNIPAGTSPVHGLRIEHSGTNNNHWTLYTANSNGGLYLYTTTGGNSSVGNFNSATGAYSSSSNRHLKDGITLLDAGTLAKVLQLEPTKYYFKRDPDQVNTLGFIAEDVQPHFPELVTPTGEEGDGLSINYAGFAVVAIKAIQELEERVRRLEQELEAQKGK